MRHGSLCTGYGGIDTALAEVLDAETVWVSDIDKGACKVLAHRYPDVPNIGDMTTVDWSTVEPVDVLSGGTPCQDLSHAGKRAGMSEGTRSNLWVAMREAIAVLRPSLVVWENVRGAASACADSEADSDLGRCPRCVDPDSGAGHAPNLRALGRVVGDLAELGYVGGFHGLRAADVGAPHPRFRFFVVAYPADVRHEWGGLAWRGRPGPPDRRPGTLLPTPTTRDHKGRNQRGDETCLTGALLPTPESSDASGGRVSAERGGVRESGAKRAVTLATAVHHVLLPTPRGTDHHDSLTAPGARRHVEAGNGTLAESIGYELLPTPRATDGTKGGPNQRGSSGELMLPSAARLLPTPTSQAAKHAGGDTDRGPGSPDDANLWIVAQRGLWGKYADAIARWEHLTREAPSPTEPGRNGNPRLSAAFCEWLMGLPAGWITDVPGITRNEALRLCGNGVVPQQCAAALTYLLNMQVAA